MAYPSTLANAGHSEGGTEIGVPILGSCVSALKGSLPVLLLNPEQGGVVFGAPSLGSCVPNTEEDLASIIICTYIFVSFFSDLSNHLGRRNGCEYLSSTLSCPIHLPAITLSIYLFYTSLSTWFSVFLSISFLVALLVNPSMPCILITCHSFLQRCSYHLSLFSVIFFVIGATFSDPFTSSFLILYFFNIFFISLTFTSFLGFSLLPIPLHNKPMLALPLVCYSQCISSHLASRASLCHTTHHYTSSNLLLLHSPYVLLEYERNAEEETLAKIFDDRPTCSECES